MANLVKSTGKDEELTVEKIRNAIPAHLFERNEAHFLVHVFYSLSLTFVTGYLAYLIIPLKLAFLPFWIIYAIINGTISIGIWVLGHECGHGAFSKSELANDILGFILHSAYLVPYFSWQHSHFVHHSRTAHITEGETHVPVTADSPGGKAYSRLKEIIGEEAFSFFSMFNILVIGWPAYLLFGASGGPARGFTSHFIVPNPLFPKEKIPKVILSNIGLLITFGVLYYFVQQSSFWTVFALYGGPYLVGNMWLTGYTFLHHNDEIVPQYDKSAWTWLKGALSTIDRGYPGFINALHYDIGSTHVVHHLFSTLPHYNVAVANEYVKAVLKDKYLYDPKNPFVSFFEAAKFAVIDHVGAGEWRFMKKSHAKKSE